jgi:hypothetical protein
MFTHIRSYFFMMFAALSLVACGGSDEGSTPPPPPPPPASPVITAISPQTGITAGGDVITITGTNFVSPVTVTFGTAIARDISVTSTRIVVAAPQVSAPGTQQISVLNSNGARSQNVSFTYVTAEERARGIMGANYFGIEDAERYFGVMFTPADRGSAAWIPFTKETLEAVKNTHILVLVPPLSIAAFKAKVPAGGFYVCPPPEWLNQRSYLTQEVQWQLIKKTMVEGSLDKTFYDQLRLLGPNDVSPLSGDLIYLIAAMQLSKDERLFVDVFVRTSDNWFGNVYEVGGQNAAYSISMTSICAGPPIDAWENVGIASQRKHEDIPRP